MANELTPIEALLLTMTRTTRLETLWEAWLARMSEYGFDMLMYAATRFRTVNGTGDLADAMILSNYPAAFQEAYLQGGLFRDAPMVRWAMNNVGSISWSEIARDAAEGRLPPSVMRVIEHNRRHGIVAGYGISFPRVSVRSSHGIGLGTSTMSQSQVDALWRDKGAEIELVCHVAHLTLLSLPYGMHGRTLTGRQREVLELVADGKTIQDAATILGLNPATIEKHLRLAREALDVDTTAQAIMKATAQNQFFRFEA